MTGDDQVDPRAIERRGFLASLEADEDDEATRRIYSDWLEENGELEEADRHRAWPAAKAWLVRFCERQGGWDEDAISYAFLLEVTREAVGEATRSGDGCGTAFVGPYESLGDSIRDASPEFWRNWSIVTGIEPPPDIDDRTYYSCAC